MALENPVFKQRKRPEWLIPVVVAACLTVLSAGYLAFGRTTYSVLFSDLRAADAAAIITQLKKDGVGYRLSQGGATISVPEAKRDAAQLAIAGSGLTLNGSEGFELFNNSDMGLTDFAQKIKYQRALQGELARTIMMMEGVKEARVHLAMPERSVFRGEQLKGKAAVSVIWRGPEYETTSQVWGVQKLVASSVPGLNDVDVTVLNGRGQMLNLNLAPLGTAVTSDQSEVNYIPSLNELREIVGRTLGNQAFDVSLESQQDSAENQSKGPSANSSVPSSNTLQSSSSVIVIVTREPLNVQKKDQITTDFFIASIIDEGHQNRIRYEVDPQLVSRNHDNSVIESQAKSQGRLPEPDVGPLSVTSPDLSNLTLWVGVVLVFALVSAAIFTAARKLLKPQMSAQAHAEFAEILSQEFQARFNGASQDAS